MVIGSTVKHVLSNHIKQDIFLAFQTGGCLLLHESSAESFCGSFLRYFHSAINNHRSITISMSPEWVVAYNRFDCIKLFKTASDRVADQNALDTVQADQLLGFLHIQCSFFIQN